MYPTNLCKQFYFTLAKTQSEMHVKACVCRAKFICYSSFKYIFFFLICGNGKFALDRIYYRLSQKPCKFQIKFSRSDAPLCSFNSECVIRIMVFKHILREHSTFNRNSDYQGQKINEIINFHI